MDNGMDKQAQHASGLEAYASCKLQAASHSSTSILSMTVASAQVDSPTGTSTVVSTWEWFGKGSFSIGTLTCLSHSHCLIAYRIHVRIERMLIRIHIHSYSLSELQSCSHSSPLIHIRAHSHSGRAVHHSLARVGPLNLHRPLSGATETPH